MTMRPGVFSVCYVNMDARNALVRDVSRRIEWPIATGLPPLPSAIVAPVRIAMPIREPDRPDQA